MNMPSAQHASHWRGFTLIETMVLVGVAAIALGAGIAAWRQWSANETGHAFDRQEANELQSMMDAAKAFARHMPDAFPDGVVTAKTADDLVSEGYLPANFAQRGGTRQGPYGDRYVVFAYREPTDHTVRVVVTEDPANRNYARHGIVDAAIVDAKRSVASEIVMRYHKHGTTIDQGTTVAVGPNHTFVLNIPWLTAPSAVVPAVLSGFPELDTGGEDDDIPTLEPPKVNASQCTLVQPTRFSEDVQCPAGYDEVARFRYCGTGEPDPIINTPYGTVTLGDVDVEEENPVFVGAYFADVWAPRFDAMGCYDFPRPVSCAQQQGEIRKMITEQSRSSIHYKTVLFNQALLGQDTCGSTATAFVKNPGPQEPCGAGTTLDSPPACVTNTIDPRAQSETAHDLICCH